MSLGGVDAVQPDTRAGDLDDIAVNDPRLAGDVGISRNGDEDRNADDTELLPRLCHRVSAPPAIEKEKARVRTGFIPTREVGLDLFAADSSRQCRELTG